MPISPISVYVAIIGTLAAAGLLLHDWSVVLAFSHASYLGLLALTALAFLSELLALSVTFEKKAGHSSITFIPLLVCQVLFGTSATLILVLAVFVPAELFIRRKEVLRFVFNVSQLTVAVILGGYVYLALGGHPLALGQGASPNLASQLVPFLAFTVVILGTNHLAVTLAIALDQRVSFRKVWKNRAGRSAAGSAYDLLISPVAIGVAFLYLELGFVGILLAILPLLFIRHSYLITYRLQEANRDLLKALVKAIETRDPYTSGHSLRVSKLAAQIAEQLGVSQRKVEAIEAAALLHDVGKIDAVYTEILRKSSTLTNRERKIIQSHVHKGADLLESLSSFGKDVIGAVKHHHERVDGKGYPDGLKGDDIPLGARIIKVCDAIDAMLSDRPYRNALDLPAVREQLTTYQGVQFDSEIVSLVVKSDILQNHKAQVASGRIETQAESRVRATTRMSVNR